MDTGDQDNSFKIGFKGRLKHGDFLEALKSRGWNQNQAAKFIGVNGSVFGLWINLKKVPAQLTRKQTSRLLELTGKLPEDLWPEFVRSKDFLDAPKTFEVVRNVDASRMLEAYRTNLELPAAPPDVVFEQGRLTEQINAVLGTLTPREEKVIRQRFLQGDTLEEVGTSFAVSEGRIQQIEAKALRKLRHVSRSRKLDPFVRPAGPAITTWWLSIDFGEKQPTKVYGLSMEQCVSEVQKSKRRVLSATAFGSDGKTVDILAKLASAPKT